VSSPAPSDRQEAGDSRRSSTGEWAPCEEKEEEKAAAAGGGIDLLPPPLRESRGGRPQARYSFFFYSGRKGCFLFPPVLSGKRVGSTVLGRWVLRATPADGVNFIPYMMLLGVE
jgi:hypothetical protein